MAFSWVTAYVSRDDPRPRGVASYASHASHARQKQTGEKTWLGLPTVPNCPLTVPNCTMTGVGHLCLLTWADLTVHGRGRRPPMSVIFPYISLCVFSCIQHHSSMFSLFQEIFMSFSQDLNFLCKSGMRPLFTNANLWAQSCKSLEEMFVASMGKSQKF